MIILATVVIGSSFSLLTIPVLKSFVAGLLVVCFGHTNYNNTKVSSSD
jgi:uncharacterized membrane protein